MKQLSILLLMAVLLAACRKEIASVTIEDPSTDTATTKPNVIFILLDDIGSEIFTYSGGQSYNTPNIDQLSKKGIQFTKCYSTPLCSPSRVELLTGKYNFRNYDSWGGLDTTNRTIGNLMQDAGYATGVFGKWQHGGGDASIKALGFQEYVVHDATDAQNRKSRYRNPYLLADGQYLSQDSVYAKYGPDIVSDSVLKFMERNAAANKPFFAYYTMMLAHKPFQPTPVNPNFLTYDILASDTTYFPEMVEYMDMLVGKVIKQLYTLKIADSTILIVVPDNGTPRKIYSYYKGVLTRGGKGLATRAGTNVPLLIFWDNHTRVGGIDSSVIDFTDFVPTLRGIAGGSTSLFGTLDGTSFYHNIVGKPGTNRTWGYCYFDAHPDTTDVDLDERGIGKTVWAFDDIYKKYVLSTNPPVKTGNMYNYLLDPFEDYRLTNKTSEEIAVETKFDNAFQQLR